jgi:hypothetical protein
MPNGSSSAQQSPDFLDQLKKLADAIKASAEAIQAVEKTLGITERSCTLEINNTIGRDLIIKSNFHDHGGFSVPVADGDVILAKTTRVLGTRSSGFLTGTEGNIVFNVKDTDILITINWVNPFLSPGGGNASDAFVSGGSNGADLIMLNNAHANGNTNVPYRYMIGEKFAAAFRQPDWRKCKKCKTLYFAPDIESSICPAGGRHEHNPTDLNFKLPHDVPGIGTQSDWRFCGDCKSIFFNGQGNTGRCFTPRSPVHDFGDPYYLKHDVELQTDHEKGWRTCINCFALFRDKVQKGCPATNGGMHNPFPDNGVLPPGHKLSNLPNRKPFDYHLLVDNGAPVKDHESGWTQCAKCDTLFSKSATPNTKCQQGGVHEPLPQGNSYLVRLGGDAVDQVTPEPGIQKRWAKCNKCGELAFSGFRVRSSCTVPNQPGFGLDGHSPIGFNFVLEHDIPGPGQDGWRFCSKCNQLAFEPENSDSHCAAGGKHVLVGHNFRLEN